MKPHLVLFACLVILIPAAAADVWYVDKDNTSGPENGLTSLTRVTSASAHGGPAISSTSWMQMTLLPACSEKPPAGVANAWYHSLLMSEAASFYVPHV